MPSPMAIDTSGLTDRIKKTANQAVFSFDVPLHPFNLPSSIEVLAQRIENPVP